MMTDDLHRTLNWMDRSKIVRILEDHGFACYDYEGTNELREALANNIEDGTIDPSVLED